MGGSSFGSVHRYNLSPPDNENRPCDWQYRGGGLWGGGEGKGLDPAQLLLLPPITEQRTNHTGFKKEHKRLGSDRQIILGLW